MVTFAELMRPLPLAKRAGLTAVCGTLIVALFALADPGPAHAQGALRSSHGDWQIRCDTPPGAQGEQCALLQSVSANRSNA